MPMPVLDSYATVGDITGLCLSPRAASTPEAADFLVHATSTAVGHAGGPGRLPGAGQPRGRALRRLPAAGSPARRTPAVFNTAVRTMEIPPLLDSVPALEAAVAPDLRDLLTVPVLDLEAITQRIDEALARGAGARRAPSP